MMRLKRTLGLATFVATVTMSVAGPAWAQPLEQGTFHEESTEIEVGFCDVAGLTVRVDQVVDGRFLLNPHGPDGLAYGLVTELFTIVFTNVDNGITVTEVTNVIFKDLHVTDNGDGTLTILVLGTGNDVVYGPDGMAIARNPGQLRFEVLIDSGGTPSDPFDDEFLAFLGFVKESTGRTDDFCAAMVPVLMG
jgi:hypothetical protein